MTKLAASSPTTPVLASDTRNRINSCLHDCCAKLWLAAQVRQRFARKQSSSTTTESRTCWLLRRSAIPPYFSRMHTVCGSSLRTQIQNVVSNQHLIASLWVECKVHHIAKLHERHAEFHVAYPDGGQSTATAVVFPSCSLRLGTCCKVWLGRNALVTLTGACDMYTELDHIVHP